MVDDSIVVGGDDTSRVPFVPYVGVAPRMYMSLFSAAKRRNADGSLVDWEMVRAIQTPRVARKDLGYFGAEVENMAVFHELLTSRMPDASPPRRSEWMRSLSASTIFWRVPVKRSRSGQNGSAATKPTENEWQAAEERQAPKEVQE
jgi:hypothetical protein